MELGSTYVPNKYVRTKESMFVPNAYYLKQYKKPKILLLKYKLRK